MAVGTMCSNMPSWFKLAAIIGLLVVFVLDMIVSALSNTEIGKESGLFPKTQAELAHKYSTPITPTDSTFAIWGFIYTYVAVALAYALSTICRKGKAGKGIYDDPEVVPPAFYIGFSTNLALTIVWLVVWAHEYITSASCLIFGSVVCVAFALQRSCAQLQAVAPALVAQGLAHEIWYVHYFVQNMAAVFLSWLTVASAIGAVVAASYGYGANLALASLVAVFCVILVISTWFILETFVFKSSLLYVFMQYPVYIVALTGIVKQGFDPESNVCLAVAFALAVTCLFFLIKIALLVYSSFKAPEVLKRSFSYAWRAPVTDEGYEQFDKKTFLS